MYGIDDTRRMLDAMMGGDRNQNAEQRKRNEGSTFKGKNICKYHLLGFCPAHEEVFLSTKRDIGHCDMVHSETTVREFRAHPSRLKYQAEYAKGLRRHLQDICKDADTWVQREKRNIEANLLKDRKPELPEEELEELQKEVGVLKADIEKLMQQAERDGEEGNIEGSQAKLNQANHLKGRLHGKEMRLNPKPKVEELCEICGVRNNTADVVATAAHFKGKLHQAYKACREALAQLDNYHTRGGDIVLDLRRGGPLVTGGTADVDDDNDDLGIFNLEYDEFAPSKTDQKLKSRSRERRKRSRSRGKRKRDGH